MESIEDLVTFAAALDVADSMDKREIDRMVRALVEIEMSPSPSHNHYELIVLNKDGSDISRKPKNLILNWKQFFEYGPSLGPAVLDLVSQGGFDFALVGLHVWVKAHEALTVKLSDIEASVIEALWRNSAGTRPLPSDEAFARTTELRRKRSVKIISRPDFEAALETLASIGCITIDQGSVRLLERVKPS